MLFCPQCQQPREGNFCRDCGDALAQPPAGDTEFLFKSNKQTNANKNETNLVFGKGKAQRVKCAQCGKSVSEAKTFDCHGPCGRQNLCLKHFDEELEMCVDCATKQRQQAGAAPLPPPPQPAGIEWAAFAAHDFDPHAALGVRTIFIVTGCWLGAELFDRPVAYELQRAITRLAAGEADCRGVVVGDMWWTEHPEQMQDNAVIAVGGPAVNAVTQWITTRGDRWESGSHHGALLVDRAHRLALWGTDPAATRAAVREYIEQGGLEDFLALCWR